MGKFKLHDVNAGHRTRWEVAVSNISSPLASTSDMEIINVCKQCLPIVNTLILSILILIGGSNQY